MVVGLLPVAPAPVPAQEITRPDRPIVYPAPGPKEAMSDAERQVEDLQANRREQQLLDEATPSAQERPDLGYDVRTRIQQGAIQRALPR